MNYYEGLLCRLAFVKHPRNDLILFVMIKSLNLENWVILYIFFELNLIKNLGYDPNLSKFKNNLTNVDEIKKIKIESFYYEVPEYLISKKIPDKASNYLIKKSLYI